MEGYEVTNDKGERAWWDGQRLVPLPKQDSPQQLTSDMQRFDQERIQPEQQRQQAEFQRLGDEKLLKNASQASVNEATRVGKGVLQNVAVPLAQAGLGLATGGMSLPAQALIGGGAELAAQKLGLSPESNTQVGLAAAAPVVGPALVGAFKGGAKAIGKMVAPAATRAAGTGAAVEQLGAIPNVIERVNTPAASKMAYQQVESTFSEVPTNVANRGITTALNQIPKSADSKAAREYLMTLSDALTTEGSMPYEAMAREIGGMRTKAQEFLKSGDLAGAKAVRAARKKIIDEMDKVSPDLAEANALYKREHNISKLEDVLTKPRADIALNQLIKKDPLVASMPKEDLKMVEGIATQLTKIGGSASPYSGVGGRLMDFFATPLAAMIESDTGRAFLRKMFKTTGTITPAGLSSAVQFWRAYEAQTGGNQ